MPRYHARESKLERECVAWARAQGWVVCKLTNPTGIPDRLFLVPGGVPWIVEFKDNKGKTAKGRAKLQAYYREKLQDDGYCTAVITTKDGFMEGASQTLEAASLPRARAQVHA